MPKNTTQEERLDYLVEEFKADSAEYKMWGNGVALPNVVFVLSGIVWAITTE